MAFEKLRDNSWKIQDFFEKIISFRRKSQSSDFHSDFKHIQQTKYQKHPIETEKKKIKLKIAAKQSKRGRELSCTHFTLRTPLACGFH